MLFRLFQFSLITDNNFLKEKGATFIDYILNSSMAFVLHRDGIFKNAGVSSVRSLFHGGHCNLQLRRAFRCTAKRCRTTPSCSTGDTLSRPMQANPHGVRRSTYIMQNVHGGQAELLNCVRVTIPPSRSIPTCGFEHPDPLSPAVTIRSSL